MKRRRYLALVGMGALAGCSGNDSAPTNTPTSESGGSEDTTTPTDTPTKIAEVCTDEGVPPEDLSPGELMPDPPGGWTIVDDPSPTNYAGWPADSGSSAEFEDQDGLNYSLHIAIFDSNAEANEVVSPSEYTGEIQAIMGSFALKVTGGGEVTPPDREQARVLALSVPCVDESNILPDA